MKAMQSTPGSGTAIFSASGAISSLAYQELTNRVTANQSFYVYLDEDSGLNHGFPSGSFSGNGAPLVTIDPGCIDNPADTVTGCFPSTDTTALDLVHGTVFRVTFPSESGAQFTGLNIEEPEDWGVFMTGSGYNLTGSANIVFDVRSPDGISLQFGVGGCTTTAFAQLPASQTYTTMTIPISSLVFSGSGAACPPDLSNLHVLFTAVTNAISAPNGGTFLLDNVHFTPVPTRANQGSETLSLPASNLTYGVVPQQDPEPGRPLFPFPTDQVNRNLASIYETSLTVLNLIGRGEPDDLTNAQEIANAIVYAIHADNHGDPIPMTPTDSSGCYLLSTSTPCGLHSGYEDGDIALYNNQVSTSGQGKAGDVRLAGFTASTSACGGSTFCVVLDGTTGGNTAFAILALVSAYRQFGTTQYLTAAQTLGSWVVANLRDASPVSYGGYFAGYTDKGLPKLLETGKSVENNADLFSAFSALLIIRLLQQTPMHWG